MSDNGDTVRPENRIGDLNGKWSALFRFVLILNTIVIPLIIMWASWMTVGQIRDDAFRGKGDRYTPTNAAHDIASVRTQITAEQLALHQEGRMETMQLLKRQDEVTQGKLEALSEKVNVVLFSLAELRAEIRARDDRRE